MSEEKHDATHDDRRHPKEILSGILTAVIIGGITSLVTSVVTAAVAFYVFTAVMEERMVAFGERLKKVENLAIKTAAEQDKRTYYVYPKGSSGHGRAP